jgi:hypothetical protein
MGLLLLGIVVFASLVLSVRAWRGYEAEVRRDPNLGGDTSVDASPFLALGQPNSAESISGSQVSHHNDCSAGQVDGCDFGGHAGFHGGGHH